MCLSQSCQPLGVVEIPTLSNCVIKTHDIMQNGSCRDSLHFETEPCWNLECAFSSPQSTASQTSAQLLYDEEEHHVKQPSECLQAGTLRSSVWNSILSIRRLLFSHVIRLLGIKLLAVIWEWNHKGVAGADSRGREVWDNCRQVRALSGAHSSPCDPEQHLSWFACVTF